MLSLLAASMSYYLGRICFEAPDLTAQQIKDRAEEMFPYRMGMNNHKDIYYMGLSCQNPDNEL